nr:hypothetical protein [uncultured Carboxylicivirga sp.]
MEYCLTFISILFCFTFANAQLTFSGGHSHNDYHRPHPLTDALEAGLVSIEADVYPVDGTLLVGHDKVELSNKSNLVNLYLHPLFDHFKDGNTGNQSVILMIDIKEKGEQAYKILKKELEPYQQILSAYRNGKVEKGLVTIILSGDRPIETVRNEKQRMVFIDGRYNKEQLQEESALIPLISDNWYNYFTWSGQGEISKKEFQKLEEMVSVCKKHNKMIRFWGYPGKGEQAEVFWRVLTLAGVDLIGTDAPMLFNEFKTK